jgi:hypothetical protein
LQPVRVIDRSEPILQATQAGITFATMDNDFATVADPAALQANDP